MAKLLISVSAALKIKPEDYQRLSDAVLSVATKNPESYKQYKGLGYSDMRYNWDVLRASRFPVTELYSYLDDNHINAALAKILKNSGKDSKGKR